MSDRLPIPLTPVPVRVEGPEYAQLLVWPFADPVVTRLLRDDIPRRVRDNAGQVWVFLDPDGRTVGFGSLDVCIDYPEYTGGRPHPYIPLLAVNPSIRSLGYGTGIVRHLLNEAAASAGRPSGCYDVLLLDVYTASVKAVELYTKLGFVTLVDAPRADPHQGGEPYLVMAQRLLVGPTGG